MVKRRANRPAGAPSRDKPHGPFRRLAARIPWTYVAAVLPLALVMVASEVPRLRSPVIDLRVLRGDGSLVNPGEALGADARFSISARARRDGYLYVAQTDLLGKVRVLHPRGGGREAAWIQAKTDLRLPPRGPGFRAMRSGEGETVIFAFLSATPRDPLTVAEHIRRAAPRSTSDLARARSTMAASFEGLRWFTYEVAADAP